MVNSAVTRANGHLEVIPGSANAIQAKKHTVPATLSDDEPDDGLLADKSYCFAHGNQDTHWDRKCTYMEANPNKKYNAAMLAAKKPYTIYGLKGNTRIK